jgi:hypothetical protein
MAPVTPLNTQTPTALRLIRFDAQSASRTPCTRTAEATGTNPTPYQHSRVTSGGIRDSGRGTSAALPGRLLKRSGKTADPKKVHEIEDMVELVEPVFGLTLVERRSGSYDLRAENVWESQLNVSATVARNAFRDNEITPSLLGRAGEHDASEHWDCWWWFGDIAWLIPGEIRDPAQVWQLIRRWLDLQAAERQRQEEDALIAEAEARAAERRRLERLSWAKATLEADSGGRRRAAIPRDVRYAVFERDGGSCVECESRFDLQYDHVIPLALGGANTLENLQLLCAPCNQRAKARHSVSTRPDSGLL